MEVLKIQKSIGELQLGMYVCELDRPWMETPFLMQGLLIECKEDIDQLEQYCKYVFIDVRRSKTLEQMTSGQPKRERKALEDIFVGKTLKPYQKETTWKEETPKAEVAVNKLQETSNSLLECVRGDTPFDMALVKKSVSGMVDSVVRNPDSSMWLTRLKNKDNYIYQHSVSCSIWATTVGRQMGLPKHDLKTLASGALLFDIGKIRLPDKLLNKTGMITPEERKLLDRHVNEGVRVLKLMNGINEDVIDIVKYHHERWDGSGYPKGLEGEEIPILARIMGIVDCYDAMTSERSYARASSPSIVIRKLYAWRDTLFQAELVEEFIQAVGLYPAGTIVQLSTREVAVVTAESKGNRLRPKILVLLDKDKKPLKERVPIDLSEVLKNEQGQSLNINKSLKPGAFGIDTQEIQI